MKREKDIKAWAEEIKELKKVIEEFTGNKVTAESLSESIKLINNKRNTQYKYTANNEMNNNYEKNKKMC